jgi:Type IV secretion-system coupling protein DNA-binding domain
MGAYDKNPNPYGGSMGGVHSGGNPYDKGGGGVHSSGGGHGGGMAGGGANPYAGGGGDTCGFFGIAAGAIAGGVVLSLTNSFPAFAIVPPSPGGFEKIPNLVNHLLTYFAPVAISVAATVALKCRAPKTDKDVLRRGIKKAEKRKDRIKYNDERIKFRDEQSKKNFGTKAAEARLFLGDERVPMFPEQETTTTLILGAPGSGKTVLIHQFCEQIDAWDEPCQMIFHERKDGSNPGDQGDFFGKYYRPKKDYLLNTEDIRCLKWNLFSEIKSEKDVDYLAESFLAAETDPHWKGQMEQALRALFLTVWAEGTNGADNKKLMDFLNKNSNFPLFIEAVENAGYAQKNGIDIASVFLPENQAGNVWTSVNRMFTKMKHRGFYYSDDGDGFGIDEWINRSKDKDVDSRLFLVNPTDVEVQNQAWFLLFLSCISRSIRSMPQRRERRICLILDEFQSFGRCPEITEKLAAEGRSKGAFIILATQNVPKLLEIYGKNLTDAILSAGVTKFIFRLGDPQSLQAIDAILGIDEWDETRVSVQRGRGMGDFHQAESTGRAVRKVLIPAELQGLAERECWYSIGAYLYKIHCSIHQILELEATKPRGVLPYFDVFEKVKVEAAKTQKTNDDATDNAWSDNKTQQNMRDSYI